MFNAIKETKPLINFASSVFNMICWQRLGVVPGYVISLFSQLFLQNEKYASCKIKYSAVLIWK